MKRTGNINKIRNKKRQAIITKNLENYFSELKLEPEYTFANDQERIELITLLADLSTLNLLEISNGVKICFFKDVFSPEKPLLPFKIIESIKRLQNYLDFVMKDNADHKPIATALVKKMFNQNQSSLDAFSYFFLEYVEELEEKEQLISESLLKEKLLSSIQNAKQSFLDTTIATALAYLFDALEAIPDTYTGTYPELLKKAISKIIIKNNLEIDGGQKNENVYFYRHLLYECAIREKDPSKKYDLLEYYISASNEMRHARVYDKIKKSVRRLNSTQKTRAMSCIQLSQIALDSNHMNAHTIQNNLTELFNSIRDPFNKIDNHLLSFDKSLESIDHILNAFEKINDLYNIDEINDFEMLSKLKMTMFFLSNLFTTLDVAVNTFIWTAVEKENYYKGASTDYQKKHMHEIIKFLKNKQNNNLFGFKILRLRENLKHFRLDNYSSDFISERCVNISQRMNILKEKIDEKDSHTNNKIAGYIYNGIIKSIPPHIKHESIFEVSNDNKIFKFYVPKKRIRDSQLEVLQPVKGGHCVLDLNNKNIIFNNQKEIEVLMEKIVMAYIHKLDFNEKHNANKQFDKKKKEEKEEEELVNSMSSLSLLPKEPEKNEDPTNVLNILSYEYLISPAASAQFSVKKNKRSKNPEQKEKEVSSPQHHEVLKSKEIKEKNNRAITEAKDHLLSKNKSSAQEKRYIFSTIHSKNPLEHSIVIAVNKQLKDENGATLSLAAQKKINSVASSIKFISKGSKGQDGIKMMSSNFYLKVLNAGGQGYRAFQNEQTSLPSGATLVVYDDIVTKKHADRKVMRARHG